LTDFVNDYIAKWKGIDRMLSTGIAHAWHDQLVTLPWSMIMGEYNTPDSVVRDRSSKSVMK